MTIGALAPKLHIVEETPTVNYSRKREETKFARAYQLSLCTLNGASLIAIPAASITAIYNVLMATASQPKQEVAIYAAILSGIFGTIGGGFLTNAISCGKKTRKDKGENFSEVLAEEKYTDLVAKQSPHVRASGLMHGALRSNFTRLITYPVIGISAGLESTVRQMVNFGNALITGRDLFQGLPVTNKIRTQFALWNLIDPQDNPNPKFNEMQPLGRLDATSIRRTAQAKRQPS